MKRVVIDTGVVVSSLLQREGTSRKAFITAFNYCEPIISFATLTEVEEVLARPKFRKLFTKADARDFITLIARQSKMIDVHTEMNLCRDPHDNMFINLAIDGKANAIISRDPDLLVLKSVHGITVLTPAEFLEWVKS